MGELLLLVTIAAASGCAVALAVRRWPVAEVAESAGRAIRREANRPRTLGRFVRARLDPAVATGFALTVALAVFVVGGAVIGVLFLVIRSHTGFVAIDRSAAVWGADHATGLSTAALRVITQLGSTVTIVSVALLVAVWEYRRLHHRAAPLFLALVVVGQFVMSNLIKFGVHRVRPTIDPLALSSGSSFPSGHSTAAAACYAAIALLAGRGRSQVVRSIVAGVAAGIAVAVAASRVLLGVHWLTDVLAGLALGWAWFALCTIAFGGHIARFGKPFERSQRSPP